MPRSAPYSSTTMAKCSCRARNAWSWSKQRRRFGNEPGLRHDRLDLDRLGPARRLDGAEQVLGVDDADDVVGLGAIDRDARVGRFQHLADDGVHRLVGVDHHDAAAMGHDVAHRAVAEIEHRLQHRLLGGRRLAFLAVAMQVDGAAQHVGMLLGVRRAVDAHAQQLEEEARDPGDGARHRAEHGERHDDRRRQHQRHAIGAQQRPGLGHHLGEDHHQDADRQRGVDDAGGAEQRGQHRRGERCREDVDHVVAQQHGAHRLVLAVEQGVHDGRALVALLGEPVHARPRGAGDGGLRRRQVGRQQQAEQHRRTRDPERHVELKVAVHGLRQRWRRRAGRAMPLRRPRG